MKNSDGTVTLKTVGRDKRGNTGGGTLAPAAGPLSAVTPGIKGSPGQGARLTTKRTPVADFR